MPALQQQPYSEERESPRIPAIYLRDCRKYFSVTTNTIIFCTKLPLEKWKKYIECMMANLSIRKCAEICGINRNTAFLWRHKILDALQNMAESVPLSGIVEGGDETFFPLSYKGSHALPEGREAAHPRTRKAKNLARQVFCYQFFYRLIFFGS